MFLQLLRYLLIINRLILINGLTLNVGLMAAVDNSSSLTPYIGWRNVAGILGVAWDRIKEEQILPQYDNWNVTWRINNCQESIAIGAVIDFAQSDIHVLFGPPCTRPAVVAGSVAKALNYPLILWGPPFDSTLLNQFEFPTIAATTSSTIYQATSLIRILEYFGWSEIAILYNNERGSLVPRCKLIVNDLETLIYETQNNISINYMRQMNVVSNTSFANALNNLKENARIVIVCVESDEARRNAMLAVAEQNLDNDEFVYIMIESRRLGFSTTYLTANDGKDELAMRGARKFLVMDQQKFNETAELVDKVIEAFQKPPFNCLNCTDIDVVKSQICPLGDAMLLYAHALNKSIANGNPNPNGMELCNNAKGLVFEGFSGTVIINQNSTRTPVFMLYNLDASNNEFPVLLIEEDLGDSNDLLKLLTTDSIIWKEWGGKTPLSTPLCGFSGDECPKSFAEQYLAIVLGCSAAVIVLVGVVIASLVFIVRNKRLDEERLNKQWQVSYHQLSKPVQKNTVHSSRSLQSTITTSTKLTVSSRKDTDRHAFYIIDNESVVARKHNARIVFKSADFHEFRKMRNIDNDYICKFIGLSLDAPQLLSIWRYCSRGSLADVIAKGALQMDWFFKYSLMRDISEGIFYLHHFANPHGWISSSTCLVDERWQVKIAFHGLTTIKKYESRELKDFLHMAPEHMRDPSLPASKAGDIYSFAIICAEIITKKSPWDLENEQFDIEELTYKIKRGGRDPIRPSLDTVDDHNGSMSLLVRDCWHENPEQRPNIDMVKTLMKSMNHNRTSNLMDHVFNVLEQYASNLEDEVQARMKELTEEKKRSDILLYRMLPKQVADKLKLGQSVEPETFDCVTIFFSDVVSFTTLASRCTPLQVVNLLNDLYTTFDAIIDNHDVYKVETIGDGYLCVSGLPHRNGNEHAKEIAEMSFSLLRAIRTFRVAHLPKERINIRIGMHTGPVVTGVVGMTMPRYCLFGDSVNTASRMESNGKPARIHISEECNEFLLNVIGGYQTEERGEVIIKGRGSVNTYWLLTEDEIAAKKNAN